MSLFSGQKDASSALTDMNSGAMHLTYEEIHPKSIPANYDNSAQLQFDFAGDSTRHILLSESYFEIRYKLGRVKKTPAGDNPAPTALEALPARVIAGDGGDGVTNPTIGISLENRPFNHCLSNIRISCNNVQVSSTNEPATVANLKDLSMTKQFQDTAATAYVASGDAEVHVEAADANLNYEMLYRPPLGIMDYHKPLAGTKMSIVMDLKNHSSYCAAVFKVGDGHQKQIEDFQTTVSTATNAINTARELYCFGIESIVFRACMVTPQSMQLPGPSVVIESEEISVMRLDGGNMTSVQKSLSVPGSTYRLSNMYTSNNPNDIQNSNSRPLSKTDTALQSLSVTVSGQQLQQPQLQGLADVKQPQRVYAEYLAALGSLTSTAEVATKTIAEFSAEPHYLSRVVQPVTNSDKEVVLRSNHSTAAQRTVVVGAHHTQAVALFYDTSGEVNQVAVNV